MQVTYLILSILVISKSVMRIHLALPVLITMLCIAIPRGNAQRSAPQKLNKQLSLAFVTNNPADFWMVARKGVEKAEKELGIKVDYQMPSNGTAAEQTQIVNDLLAKGVDGIAISPVDPDNQTNFINSTSARTLVFTQDSDAPHSKRTCFIGTDNIAAGYQAGEELKKALPRGGNIMIFVGRRDARNAADRIKGLKESLGQSRIKVLGVRTDDTDRVKAKANVSDALIRYPKLAACVGIWSYNGPAILSALRDAKKTGKVKIVCFDEEEDVLSGIKNGEISAAIVQQPFQFGYQSIINMAKFLRGDKSVVPANRQVFIPTVVIRQKNVASFRKQLAQLRGR
ncbi:ABC transporter substrate-binding protein [bacterium]|nr:MAG: ABC transporter substrate-binding protein [bacterium]